MATRQQVLSLFGATPAQIQERQRQQQQELLAAQRTPETIAGSAIGLGLARLFGGKSPEIQAAEQMQQAVAGVDPNNPEALRELAQTVASFAPERALQIAVYAGELEKSQMPATIDVPTIVGYETEPDIDTTTGLQRVDENKQPLFKQTPIYRNVPFERTPTGLKSLVPGYSLPSGASTAVKDETKPKPSTDTVIDLGEGASLVRPGAIAEARSGTPSTTTQAPLDTTGIENMQATVEQPALQVDMPVVKTREAIKTPPKIEGQQVKTGIDAVSNDAIISRYRALKKKRGRKPSEDLLLKKLEAQLLNRGLNEAL
jgi:hypothetical protein